MIEKKRYLETLKQDVDRPGSGLERVRDPETIEAFEARTGKVIGMIDNAPYYQIRMDLFRNTETDTLFRYCNIAYPEKRGAAALVVLRAGGEKLILIERHYRVFARCDCYEIPRGYSDPKDSDSQWTALRELEEETGIDVTKLDCVTKKLGSVLVDSGLSNNVVDLYAIEIFTDVLPALRRQDRGEPILDYQLIPLPKVEEYIRQGIIQDSFTLNALYFYSLNT